MPRWATDMYWGFPSIFCINLFGINLDVIQQWFARIAWISYDIWILHSKFDKKCVQFKFCMHFLEFKPNWALNKHGDLSWNCLNLHKFTFCQGWWKCSIFFEFVPIWISREISVNTELCLRSLEKWWKHPSVHIRAWSQISWCRLWNRYPERSQRPLFPNESDSD